jgi:hypothetical protein
MAYSIFNMTSFLSGLLGWSTPKQTRKVGTIVKESELENRIEVPITQTWLDSTEDTTQDHFRPLREEFLSSELEETKSVARSIEQANPIVRFAKDWDLVEASDDYRVSYAHRKGGVPLTDVRVQNQIRESGSEIIKSMGRKILSGDFNLTTISFPIKCMEDKTILHNTVKAMLMDPLYLTRASLLKDPVERLKLVVISRISCFIHTCTFLKPVKSNQMNPVLGETLHAKGADGSLFYCEQTGHHPPVSHFLVYGPQERYTCSGYYVFEAKAGLNSLKVVNSGKRRVTFSDGQTVTFNCPNESFTNTLIGTLKHEVEGPMVFIDEANQLEAIVTFGKINGKPSDYVQGFIIRNCTQLVSKLSGTYLGWLSFDGRRYWDARDDHPYSFVFEANLPSDSEVRPDLLSLRRGNVEKAQRDKESLEALQRRDRAVRANYLKRKKSKA